MWPSACETMHLDIYTFLEHPGKHLPIDVRLNPGQTTGSPDEIRFIEEIALTGEAFAQLGTLYLNTRIKTAIERSCRRCLAPVREEIDLSEQFSVEIPEGKTEVDLVLQILASITAALDPHPLCRPDCRGLCPVCGTDLNENPDHACETESGDHLRLGDFLK